MLGLHAVYDAWRSRKPRAAAIRVLSPFFARSRRSDGRRWEAAWTEPYLIGFAATAISRLALAAVPLLRTESLAAVQLDAWTALTGLPNDLLSERLLTLSLDGHPDFVQGCTDALAFVAAMGGGVLGGSAQRAAIEAEVGSADFGCIGVASTDLLPTDLGSSLALWDQAVAGRLT